MPRVKIPRKSTAIDMTAMCDVAFLLLTFFILTAKPRTDDPIPVDAPATAINVQLPESDVAILTVGQGKVFFGVEGQKTREELLDQMGRRYSIAFTPEEKAVFASLPSFGVDIQNLKGFLALSPDERKEYKSQGIPTDTTTESQLFYWVKEARIVTKNLNNKELRIAIKGDGKEEYPTFAKLIKALQKQKVNKFALITNVKSLPK
ncbi:ExbD/TolR family protein [Mucilaginibacter myungsuensis]|uniref:Biopolymer transporter ExbD n=1 Tax=Mucilaginibacter myungsuensis TaxID=649104 RepID=A0A929KX80_9SPHI|nr:biopolymer transporter ExbD [Mucilaginibacter myungsuensis]MBE9662327.1 biopolymer transporter ExbD [Mucilaginibacter myungsuensis]MDN3599236.1 biopolymer transporter ExbD [Mucilaginibacter myungsuensis]